MLVSKRFVALGRTAKHNKRHKKPAAIRISLRAYCEPTTPEGTIAAGNSKKGPTQPYREPISEYTPLFEPVRAKPEDIKGPIVEPISRAAEPSKIMEDLLDYEDKYSKPKEHIVDHSPKNIARLRKSKRLKKMYPLDNRTEEEKKMDKSIASLWNKLLGGINGGTIVRQEGDRLKDAHAHEAMQRLRTYVIKNLEENPTSFDELAAKIQKVQERSAYFASDWSIKNPKIVDKAYRWMMEEMSAYVEGNDLDNEETDDQEISLGAAVDVKAEEAEILGDYDDDEIPDRPFDPLELMEFDHNFTVGERKFHTWIAPDEVQYYDDENLQYDEFMKHRPKVERRDLFKSGWRHAYTLDAMNVALLARFMNKTGRILPRHITGLSSRNQKRVAKKIRHARHLGLFSYKGSQFRINNPFVELSEAEKKENPWLVARYKKDQEYEKRVEAQTQQRIREEEHKKLKTRVANMSEVNYINETLAEHSEMNMTGLDLREAEDLERAERGQEPLPRTQDEMDYDRLMQLDGTKMSYTEMQDYAIKEGILDEEDRHPELPDYDVEAHSSLDTLKDTRAPDLHNIDALGRLVSEVPEDSFEEKLDQVRQIEEYDLHVDKRDEQFFDALIQGKSAKEVSAEADRKELATMRKMTEAMSEEDKRDYAEFAEIAGYTNPKKEFDLTDEEMDMLEEAQKRIDEGKDE